MSLRRRSSSTITAAAERVDTEEKGAAQKIAKRRTEWQGIAWNQYDTVPELWFGVNYVANALRRVRPVPAVLEEYDQPPVPLDPDTPQGQIVYGEMERMRDDDGSLGTLMHDAAIQLTIPGEGLLAGFDSPDYPGEEVWGVYSLDELKLDESKGSPRWVLSEGPGARDGQELVNAVVSRIWRQHPRFKSWADSALRPLLDVCDELGILDRNARGAGRSRLANGVYLIPDEANFKRQPGANGVPITYGYSTDPFIDAFIAMAVTPIQDEGTAGAVAPGVLKVKGDLIEKFHHQTFGREFTAEAAQRQEFLLRRLATGMDFPSSVITGIEDLNHWTAWQVPEESFDTHLAPLCELICSCFTKVFMKPALSLEDGTVMRINGKPIIIWYDASALISHPGRVGDADNALKLGGIGYTAYRRYKGYSEEDTPTEEDIALLERLQKVAGAPPGGTGPGVTAAAAPAAQAPSNLGRTLTRLERDTRLRVQASASTAFKQVMAAHGVTLTADAEEQADEMDEEDVEARHYAELGATLTLFGRQVSAAQERLRSIARDASILDEIHTEQVLEEFAARQAEDLAAATEKLDHRLTRFVSDHLNDATKPAAPDRTIGEGDSMFNVPAEIVRDAMSEAGGGVSAASVNVPGSDAPPSLVAGDTTIDLLKVVAGMTPAAWVWDYGDVGSRGAPFDGHLNLDGKEFADWQDQVLAVQPGDEWLGVDYYFPGDHLWCQCDFSAVFTKEDTE